MADENASRDVTSIYRETDRRLDALSETEGAIGVEQRGAKDLLRRADKPADAQYAGEAKDANGLAARGGFYFRKSASGPAAPAPLPAAATPASGPENGGLAVGGAGGKAAEPPADDEAKEVAENVRSIGSKVFYRRGDKWVDSAVTPDQEKQPIKIERYSKEYFALIDKHGPEVAKYMTFDEPVVIEIDGKAYTF